MYENENKEQFEKEDDVMTQNCNSGDCLHDCLTSTTDYCTAIIVGNW